MRAIAPKAQHETVTAPAEVGDAYPSHRRPTAREQVLAVALYLFGLAALLTLLVKLIEPVH